MNKLQVIENFCYKLQQKSEVPSQKIRITLDRQHKKSIEKELFDKTGAPSGNQNQYTLATDFGVDIEIKFRKSR